MKKFISILMSFLMFYGCTSDSEETLGSIYGVVTLAATAEPMRATGVELYSSGYGALLLKTVTFDDGSFQFDDLNEGYYRVVVLAEGYEGTEYEVYVETGRMARADMQLTEINTYMTISTLEVTDVVGNGATFTGRYDYENYKDADPFHYQYGFVYSQSSNPRTDGIKVVATNATYNKGSYDYSAMVSGLARGTYYVQAYATNHYGTAYGNVLSFDVSGNPVVTTKDATNISNTTATLNGVVDYEGSPAYTEKGFVYSASFPNPTINDPSSETTKVPISGNDKEFSANIAGLTPLATYYVRTYITNENGTTYGEARSFIALQDSEKIYILSGEGLMVQKQNLGYANYLDAVSMCSASRVGGYDDWRLPTSGELAILYKNREVIGGFGTEDYWSKSYYTTKNGYDYHYIYDFYYGKLDNEIITSQNGVRAVRSIN